MRFPTMPIHEFKNSLFQRPLPPQYVEIIKKGEIVSFANHSSNFPMIVSTSLSTIDSFKVDRVERAKEIREKILACREK